MSQPPQGGPPLNTITLGGAWGLDFSIGILGEQSIETMESGILHLG